MPFGPHRRHGRHEPRCKRYAEARPPARSLTRTGAWPRASGRQARRRQGRGGPPRRLIACSSGCLRQAGRSPARILRTASGRRSSHSPRGSSDVLAQGGTLVCEAGTGTGKSLGYLVPACALGPARDRLDRDARAAVAAPARRPAARCRGARQADPRRAAQGPLQLRLQAHGRAARHAPLRPPPRRRHRAPAAVARRDADRRSRRARPRAARRGVGGGRSRSGALPGRALPLSRPRASRRRRASVPPTPR